MSSTPPITAMTIPLPPLPQFQAETLPARFKRLATGAKPKQFPSKFYGALAPSIRKRSPLSRSLSATLPPAPRTIYSLNSQARPLSRSFSMPSSTFESTSSIKANLGRLQMEHSPGANTSEPGTPKSRIRSSVWISMPNTPPESHSPPPILSSKLKTRKRLRSKKSRTLEWACAKDSKHMPRRNPRESDDESEEYQVFSRRLSFPSRRGLGIVDDPEGMELDSNSENWRSPDFQSSRRSSWSSTASTEDEMEVTTPIDSMEEISSFLPDIVITTPDGLSGLYNPSYVDRQLANSKGMGPSKEEEDAATILVQLRHHSLRF